jgi:CheY-like chemotaxis protein
MTCRILVVDDQADMRDTLVDLLSLNGHSAHPACNEAEALAAVVKESFDFALIDVRLHGEDEDDESGLSLAMALRMLKPLVHVILLTRYIRTRQIVRAVRYHGVADFIEKTPDVGAQILKTIDEISREVEHPRFEKGRDSTRLLLSIESGRPVMIRAYGHYVSSAFSSRTLEVDIKRYARRADNARRDPINLRFEVGNIGSDLWHEVFSLNPEVKIAYVQARAKSQVLSLSFETSREYLQLPIEFMRVDEPAEYLVLEHPVCRFVRDAFPKRDVLSPEVFASTEQLRVLVVASNTEPPIDGVDIEAQKLTQYLRRQDYIPVNVQHIATKDATYERVKDELRNGKYDIIHYAGHGSYEAQSPEESSLYFWAGKNKQGGIVPMPANELKMLLAQSEARLAYLSCCYGAAAGGEEALLDDDFLGLADAVAQAGIPSVVGCRWPLSDVAAPKLALAFYGSLLKQGSPEIALWSARCELAGWNRNDPTWLSPVLIHQE